MRKLGEKVKAWLIRDKYAGDKSATLADDLGRLRKGEPVDYVIGWSDFCGCRIGLETRPLIPRSETEYWAEQAVKEIGGKPVKCLDIFSGSGCVGIAVLKHCPNATMDFGEKSAKFCRQIKTNCDLNGIDLKHYRVIQSDIFNPRILGGKASKLGKYDLILANPPYVPAGRKLDKSVTDWEPAGALYAKDDGLFLIKKFLGQAKKHLNAGGKIYLEFDSGQKTTLAKLLTEFEYKNIDFHKDQFGRWRFVAFQN